MVKKKVETQQERERLNAARRFWKLTFLSIGCYICGGFFIAVMAIAKDPLGAGLAALAALLFIICARIAGGGRIG